MMTYQSKKISISYNNIDFSKNNCLYCLTGADQILQVVESQYSLKHYPNNYILGRFFSLTQNGSFSILF
jgi:hypothetical protein